MKLNICVINTKMQNSSYYGLDCSDLEVNGETMMFCESDTLCDLVMYNLKGINSDWKDRYPVEDEAMELAKNIYAYLQNKHNNALLKEFDDGTAG